MMNENLYNQFYIKVGKLEGFRSKTYRCPAGYLTVGYGHRVNSNVTISRERAEELLHEDFEKIFNKFANYPFVLQTHEMLAISDLIFNVGETTFKNSHLYKELQSYSENLDKKAWKSASCLKNCIRKNLLTWCHATVNGEKVVLPGLVDRCIFRAKLFCDGKIY